MPKTVKQPFLKRFFSWIAMFLSWLGFYFDLLGIQTAIATSCPALMPFLKVIGISLFLTLIAWVVLYWEDHKDREQSSRQIFTRIAALADRIDQGQATTEETQEYYDLLTSFGVKERFRDYDSKDYKGISKRARFLAERFF